MLKQRVITALILAPLVIAALFYLPKQLFDLFALAITLLAAWEFSGFFAWNTTHRLIFLFALTLIIFLLKIALFFAADNGSIAAISRIIASPAYLYILFSGLLWWLAAPYFLNHYIKTGKNIAARSPVFLGIIIFIPFWASIVVINNFMGAAYFLLLLAIVWSSDIGAYFAGMFFGKTILAGKVSPKKTIEGVIGGVILSSIITFALLKIFMSDLAMNKLAYFMLLSITVSLWSVIGDLFESMLKRIAGLKDSGNLLPGHGGLYDRIDSLTAAAPIFALGLLLI